jgi:adenylate cyclase
VVVATVAFAVLGPSRPGLLVLVLLTGFALHVGAWFLFPDGQAGASPDFLAQLYVNSALTVFAVTAAIAFYAFWVVEQAEAETEALLRNVLPDLIVERLKRQPDELVADTHAEVSVLFSDIKSFVPLAHSLGALRTVEMLNDLVRGFDRLASLHGVEKIKTIGDAYMAVAGLPEPAADHAVRQARMALAMQESARETASRFGVEIVLRIGIATGPVMAGVIGTRKFSYDVWGDAVNLAARLEQTCEVGRVHISTATRTRLGELFQVRPRGAVPIKGLGPVETFTLLGPALGGPERPGRAA